MANKYSSDLHLGHENITRNIRTQFHDVDEMDAYLIKQWNEHVDKDDDIWIVGDLSYRAKCNVKVYLDQMNGRHKHLIIGNHDVKWMKNVELSRYFESVSHMEVIKDNKNRNITLCHYPLMEWSGSRYAKYSLDGTSWLIHGHIHNSKSCNAYYQIRDYLPCALNCGCDINNYHPVTFEELLENNDQFYYRLNSYRTLDVEEFFERSIVSNPEIHDYFMDGMK